MFSSRGEKVFQVINLVFLGIVALTCLLPFVYMIALSFSSLNAVMANRVTLWPVEFQLDGYRMAFGNQGILRSFVFTVYLTVLGTLTSLVLTTVTAYPLSKPRLRGRKQLLFFVTFTMLFSGGMIPTLLVVKATGLINSTWAMIIPGAMSAYNMLIMRTYFMNAVPHEIEESATIDGSGTLRTLLSIVLPVSTPILATIAIFYAVSYWNTFTACLLYINDPDKFTLQMRLRQLIMLNQSDRGMEIAELQQVTAESLKAATIVITTVPILLVYPWLQKYFVKGVMLGSLKG
jgi:putative aldouronate transport system permease protein